eukprot:Hpha_TRINITY_DN15674_c0_g2::TRINITY_DN15674_c0_g2_i3::g.98414::m.98414
MGRFAVLLCGAAVVLAERAWLERIPNGMRVDRKGSRWSAVGHDFATVCENDADDMPANAPPCNDPDPLNSFGRDFEDSGERWTRSLCMRDSDGDGFTNGQELGDPSCIWSPGNPLPDHKDPISHPGYADSTPPIERELQEKKAGGELAPGFTMAWQVVGEELEVRFTCPATQYCSIGLEPAGLMPASDTIMCWMEGAQAVCEDGYSPARLYPDIDTQQDVTVVASAATGDSWEVTFRRKLVTGDRMDFDFVLGADPQVVTWALGPVNVKPLEHTAYGSVPIVWENPGGKLEVRTPAPVTVVKPSTDKVGQGEPLELVPGMVVSWQLTESRSTAVFTMKCEVGEYCSIGLSPSGMMAPSDSWTCWDDGQGNVLCEDQTCHNTDPCPPDAVSNIVVRSSGVTGGFWDVVFERALVSGDAADMTIPSDVAPMIFCKGKGTDSRAAPVLKHHSHGSFSIKWGSTGPATIDLGTPTPVKVVNTDKVTEGKPVQLVPGMVVSWQLTATKSAAVFTMKCEVGEYCSIGLSPSGKMAPSDSWTCWDDNQGNVLCEDQTCHNTDPCPPDSPGLMPVLSSSVASGQGRRGRVLGAAVVSGFWEVTFERPVVPADAMDFDIPTDVAPLIWCKGRGSRSVQAPSITHHSHGTAKVNWATGTADVVGVSQRSFVHVIVPVVLLVLYGGLVGALHLQGLLKGFQGERAFILVGASLSGVIIIGGAIITAIGDAHEYEGRDGAAWVGFGGAAQFFLTLAMLTPLKTFSPLLWTMDLPPERALWWHRAVGRLGWVVLTFHAVGYMGAYSGAGRSDDIAEPSLPTTARIDGGTSVSPLYGLVAWCFYTVLTILGLPVIRRRLWECFYWSHVLLAWLTVLFAWLHLPGGWRNYVMYVLPLVLYVLDSGLKVYRRMHSRPVLWSAVTDTCVTLHVQMPMTWGPGSWMNLCVPGVSRLESHPFTLANMPDSKHHAPRTGVFYIKDMGPGTWSAKVRDYVAKNRKMGFEVSVHGPFGRMEFDINRQESVLMFAGGIGITPMLGLMEAMQPSQKGVLVWTVREEGTLSAISSQLSDIARRRRVTVLVHFTGGTQRKDSFSSVDRMVKRRSSASVASAASVASVGHIAVEMETISTPAASDAGSSVSKTQKKKKLKKNKDGVKKPAKQKQTQAVKQKQILPVLTPRKSLPSGILEVQSPEVSKWTGDSWRPYEVKQGRPDFIAILAQHLVPGAGVVLCGPEAMVDAVKGTLSRTSHSYPLHVETFEF